MAKKKTRAADVRRQLAEEEREPSPFAGIVLKEKPEEKPAKKRTLPVKAKKPGEIVQGYDPSASFADILHSFETTGNPYTLQKPKAKSVTSKKTDFGDILNQWEGKVRKDIAKSSSPERKSPAYKPTKSFADILNAYEGVKPERKVSEEKVADKPHPSVSGPVKRSEPYKPAKSFGDILDDFENPGARGKKAVKAIEEKASARKEEPVVLSDTLFKTPEDGDVKAEGASWSIFGGRNESYVRPEKPAEEMAKEKPARRVSEPYKPTKSFDKLLSDYDKTVAPGTDAPVARQEEDVSYTKTLFKTPEEDEKRAEGASWSVFGDNDSFVRPEPVVKAEEVEAQGAEEPKKPERVSPAYKPTKSFEDILSDYAQKRAQSKPQPVKKTVELEGQGTLTLFKTPEEGAKRAEGVAWSIYGGNKARKPAVETGREESTASSEKAETVVPSYEPTREFSDILSEYDRSVPRQDKVKTFEELMKEKADEERPKSRLTIGKLRNMPPQSTLDLHGMTVPEAEQSVTGFLAECREHGLRKISIITGKGLHSEDGVGVLKGAAERVLDNSGLVREKTPAPVNAGGSGALWVILKDEEQD